MIAPHRLSEAEYDRLPATSPPHRPLIAALKHGVLLLPIQAGAEIADPRACPGPWVTVVGDDHDRSQGPSAFDTPGLRRLARAATGVIVYSGAAEERFYLLAPASLCSAVGFS